MSLRDECITLPDRYDTAVVYERDDLSASPIACAVADAWCHPGGRFVT